MSDLGQGNKVLGIETNKYAKLSYVLILVASGLGLFSNLMALASVYILGGMMFGLLGLIGIVLAITGLVAFKDKFSALDISHFIFLVILFFAFFALAGILGNMLVNMGAVGSIILFLLSAFQFALLFTGFQLWQNGELVTKDSLINGLKNLTSKFKS